MKMPQASREEFKAIYGLLRFAVMQSKGDPDAEPLRVYARKMREAGEDLVCRHCGVYGARRADRICDACNTYRHKYGHLPERATLERRVS